MKRFMMVAVMALTAVALFAGCAKKEATSFVVLDESLDAEEYGIGFRVDDVQLGLEVQAKLDEMIADGTAAEISQKWFGEDILIKEGALLKQDTADPEDMSYQNVLDKGKLVLGLDDSFPPMGFRDENNNIVGFDIDLATEVCKRMNVELVLQPIDWDAKELELSTGRIDCIWNGMTITPQRLENMYFTRAYIANEQIIIVPEGSSITKISDLAGKTVGLQKGSSSLDALNKNPIVSEVKEPIVELPDNMTVFLELKAGRIDAFVVDEVAGRYIISHE